MRVLIDLCVESDGLMFKELMDRLLDRGHDVLLTARKKINAIEFYRYLGLDPHVVGLYSTTRKGKLLASAQRIYEMAKLVLSELGGLDAVVSNTGVEACRVGLGLGASVHTFHDHPEAIHQLLLTIPLSNYVYVPWVIDRGVYIKYGLSIRAIINYRGFLTLAWMPHLEVDEDVLQKLGLNPEKPVVVFRESEVGAAYLFGREAFTLPAIKKLAEKMADTQFVARPRYSASRLQKYFNKCPNVKVFVEPIPLQSLLAKASLLVGGGATMCLEATYFGTPTITCRPIKSPITDFLNNSGLAWEANSAEEILALAEEKIGRRNEELAGKVYGDMEFPLEELIKNIEAAEKVWT